MKERIIRVMMAFSFLIAIGIMLVYSYFAFFDYRVQPELMLVGLGLSSFAIFVSSATQYIIIAEWNPLYLFKRSEKKVRR